MSKYNPSPFAKWSLLPIYSKDKVFYNIVREGENVSNLHFLLFPLTVFSSSLSFCPTFVFSFNVSWEVTVLLQAYSPKSCDNNLNEESFQKHCGKGQNAGDQHFLI